MDNDNNIFEILIPLVFAAIYFFGNMLSGKGDGADGSEKSRRRERDPESAQRQRRIQDEIRRKIAERRDQVVGRHREDERPRPPVTARSSMNRRHRRSVEEEPVRSTDSTGNQPTPYETRMEAQLRRIEATKRQAEKLQKKALTSSQEVEPYAQKEIGASLTAPRSRRTASSRLRRRPIRSTLADPTAARTAFIHSEILNQPTGLRKMPTIPGLSG